MEILAGLNPEQLEAVTHFEGPLLIIAGAGSGKTRVITHRMAYLIGNHGILPERILGVTFTNKAAEEMRTRVERLLGERKVPWIRTFHSTCARVLRQWAHLLPGYDQSFTILDDQDSRELLATAIKELNGSEEQFSTSMIGSLIERAKDELLGPEEFLHRYAGRLDDHLLERVYPTYKGYQQALERSNSLDFADLIRLTVQLLQENLELLDIYRQRFQFILVDEYQDINYAQYIFARLLSERYENICVVGDDDQAIYGWRGADPSWLLRFEEDFPRAKVVRLKFNYRSPGRVLRAAQTLIRHNPLRQEKGLQTLKEDGHPLQIYAALDERDEANYIAMEIERLWKIEGIEPGKMALLYRVNTLSRALEEALIARGIPYKVVRGLRFYERMEVKDLISYLRLIVNPVDELSLLRALNRPRRGLGKETVAAIKSRSRKEGLSLWEGLQAVADEGSLGAVRTAQLQGFVAMLEELRASRLCPAELAEEILVRTGYLETLQGESTAEERRGNIKELLGQLGDLKTLEELGDFLEGLALVSDADSYTDDRWQVALMTLHVSKGLEFEVVFIIGLEEGLLPHARVIREGRVEEERRLIYVGMTRAKERLYLSYAAQRSLYGTISQSPPSRFLGEIPQVELDGIIPRFNYGL